METDGVGAVLDALALWEVMDLGLSGNVFEALERRRPVF